MGKEDMSREGQGSLSFSSAGEDKGGEAAVSGPLHPVLQPAKGTYDLLPGQTERWQHLEALARTVFAASGYREIRVPLFEHTELFKRSVGETTDIVNKEMYTFTDKANRSLTLRPEGTAGVVRAYLNGGLNRLSPPVKLWYSGPMFRYESIKAGRQRQFNQIGLEAFGCPGPLMDAEVILVARQFLQDAGLSGLELHLNSIGCKLCRPAYRQALKDHLSPHLNELCQDCRRRFELNPLRMLDCKVKHDQEHYQNVPVSFDYLCLPCQNHWQGLNALLKAQNIEPVFNKRMVRGLDYYTRTVFEFISNDARLGASSTICAGGRYDNLIETFGGQPTAAIGWGIGVERLLTLLDTHYSYRPAAFIVSSNQSEALKLAQELRKHQITCELDYPSTGSEPRGLSKQLQQANKTRAIYAVIAGDDELAAGQLTLKNMQDGSQIRTGQEELIQLLSRLPGSTPGAVVKEE